MSNHLHLLITGGTIDSIFDPAQDSIVVSGSSALVKYLESMIQPHFKITQEIITLRDSREITDNIRAEIVSSIEKSQSDYFLVTHGTYTMAATAEYLKDNVKSENKRVVLTGSMYPLHGFSPTDASFNLGFAIGSLFLAAPGIYIAMNGKLFPAGTAVKNTKAGRFE